MTSPVGGLVSCGHGPSGPLANRRSPILHWVASRMAMVGPGWPSAVLAGRGWLALGGPGWPWLALGGHDALDGSPCCFLDATPGRWGGA